MERQKAHKRQIVKSVCVFFSSLKEESWHMCKSQMIIVPQLCKHSILIHLTHFSRHYSTPLSFSSVFLLMQWLIYVEVLLCSSNRCWHFNHAWLYSSALWSQLLCSSVNLSINGIFKDKIFPLQSNRVALEWEGGKNRFGIEEHRRCGGE